MGTADFSRVRWLPARGSSIGRELYRWTSAKLCSNRGCRQNRNLWRRLGQRGTFVAGSWYCVECLESALTALVQESMLRPLLAPEGNAAPPPAHRVPLGLLLLSRQQITPDQLRQALGAQRAAGHGRIGEWLMTLGFAGEAEITAALARQWSCPILRAWPAEARPSSLRMPQVPASLLAAYRMALAGYSEATATLHVAFAGRVDYGVLHAIEHMLGCRTEPCLASPSLLRPRLAAAESARSEREIVLDGVADGNELGRMIRSYAIRMSAAEVRLAFPSRHVWARIITPSRPAFDMLLGMRIECSRATAIAAAPSEA